MAWPGPVLWPGRCLTRTSREKRLKGCTAAIVPDHSAFRKRKSNRRRVYLCAVGLRKRSCNGQRLAAAIGQPEILRTFTVSLRLTLVIELWNGESSTSSSSDNNQNPAVRMPKRSSRQTELASKDSG